MKKKKIEKEIPIKCKSQKIMKISINKNVKIIFFAILIFNDLNVLNVKVCDLSKKK